MKYLRHLGTALVLGLALVLAVTLLIGAPGSGRATVSTAGLTDDPPSGRAASTGTARNAIVFLVDDMSDFSCSTTRAFLPRSATWLRDRGTCYENATTATPVCCPARAQVQTGQLGHNNRVRTQLDARRLDITDTVQHDLGEAGIRTYGIGKNLNGVKVGDYFGPHALDTGFDEFDFWNSYRQEPGRFQRFDDDGDGYIPTDGLSSTETNGALLDAALDDYLTSGERFYVYDAFFAPHKQVTGDGPLAFPVPTPAHAEDPVTGFHYSPEVNARDKLRLFREPRRTRAYYQQLWTAKVRTMHDVDDQMAHAFERLEAAGVLDETAVIFTSDNGYTDHGQVNWDGKAIPYPSSTDIPMLAFYPGATPALVTKSVQLIDVAPTLYDVLGVTPGHVLDGHSLRGPHRRTEMYGEFSGERDQLVLEESGRATGYVPTWRLLKRGELAYVEWYRANGKVMARELYRDPGMLRNVLWKGHRGPRASPATVRSLHQRLMRLARCSGTADQGSSNPCT